MRVSEWARREGFNVQTVWQWCREGRMPVPFERLDSGTIIIHDPKYEAAAMQPRAGGRTACYARVGSSDQKDDLARQADRLKAFAIGMGVDKPEVITEVGSGADDGRRKLNRILADPSVGTLVVERGDRLSCVGAGLVRSALEAQGRRLIVVDDEEPEDALVDGLTDALVAYCARLYGRRAARRKADAALVAARDA
ncbi:MAG: IS607 family transposase [Bifidobacteriaceae bacterium]|nr:IS607 family transposase [Bifidobacteriaceae bacterium]